MNISIQTKVISLPILVGLILTAALLWPAHALADGPICSGSLGLPISDSDGEHVPGPPTTHAITVTDTTLIADLNIAITTTHPYVGDLIFALTHKVGATMTSTTIISRPLRGASVLPHEVSCSGDNINVTLDDQAVADIQVNCAEGLSHGDGTEAYIAGQSYRPYSLLNLFNGDFISGTWELTITDNFRDDTGTLDGWCLVPNSEGDLQIFKTVTPSHPLPNQPITYTLSFKNLSNVQTAANVVITDIVPISLTNVNFVNSEVAITPTAGITYAWQVADLLPGDNGIITITGVLSSGLPGGTTFSNIATIATTSVETDTANNSGEAVIHIQPPNLQLTKDDGGITATPGSAVTYTLSYANIGGTATGVVITETLPNDTNFNAVANPGWQQIGATNQYTYSVGPMNNGASLTTTFVVTVANSLPTGVEFINNTAEIGDDGTNDADLYPNDNFGSDITPVDATPDLAVTKADGGITVTPGSLITYTLTYTNKGGQDATGVVITETVPANTSFNSGSPGWQQVGATNQYTYNVGSLNVGPSQAITFVVSVSNSLPSGVNTITNTAQIGDDGNNGTDPTPGDNTTTETTPVITGPNLAIAKADGGITATAGSLITYTLTYTNKSGQDATGVVITETVPANTSFNSGSPGWQQVGATSQYTYNVGSLSVGPSQAITFVVAVNNPLPGGVSTITNTVQIGDNGANGADQDLSDNQDEETTPTAITSQKIYLPLILRNN